MNAHTYVHMHAQKSLVKELPFVASQLDKIPREMNEFFLFLEFLDWQLSVVRAIWFNSKLVSRIRLIQT